MPTQAMDAAIVANTHCHRCHQHLAEYRRKSEGGMMCHNSIRICKNKNCEDYLNLAGSDWHETNDDWKPEVSDIKRISAMNIVPQEMRRQGLENAKKFGKKW